MTDSWVKSQEISSELWKGKIPIVIDVMASEIATLTPPKALYVGHRLSLTEEWSHLLTNFLCSCLCREWVI